MEGKGGGGGGHVREEALSRETRFDTDDSLEDGRPACMRLEKYLNSCGHELKRQNGPGGYSREFWIGVCREGS